MHVYLYTDKVTNVGENLGNIWRIVHINYNPFLLVSVNCSHKSSSHESHPAQDCTLEHLQSFHKISLKQSKICERAE